MDILMTPDQEMVRDSVRGFLAAQCPPSLVRRMEEDPLGYDPALWSKAAELGLQGMALPEVYGGSGLPLSYLGIVLQEIGRAVAPLPLHGSSVAALTIAEAGPEALREKLLPKVADGSVILSWALEEADMRGGVETVAMTATRDGDGFVLDGTKNFVDSFKASDYCVVVCRTGKAAGANGLSLFLVDAKSEGISETPLVTTAKDRQSALAFSNVRVPAANLIGRLNEGGPAAQRMLDRATALLCAQMTGAARKNMEMTVEYAKFREAFGQPIGGFQAIQHMCADMVIWIDGGELLTFEALWCMDQGLPCAVEVSQAKAFCNEKLLASARNAQIIHGGIGFTMEFDLHLWYRRIAAWSMRLGTTYAHRARIAQALIDHPGDVRLGRPLPGTEIAAEPEVLRKSA